MSELSSQDLAAIARRWSLVNPDADFCLTVSDSRQPGVLLVALHEAPKDVTALLVEVSRLRARVDVLTDQVAGRDATIQRVRDEAETMRDEAVKTLALDPVEDGVSAGERYEAEVQRYVAARVLIVLEGDPQEDGDPADDGSRTDG